MTPVAAGVIGNLEMHMMNPTLPGGSSLEPGPEAEPGHERAVRTLGGRAAIVESEAAEDATEDAEEDAPKSTADSRLRRVIERMLDDYQLVESDAGNVAGRVAVPRARSRTATHVVAAAAGGYAPTPPNIALTREDLAQDMVRRAFFAGTVARGSFVEEALSQFYAVASQTPVARDVWIRVAPWETPDGQRAIIIDLAIPGRGDCLLVTASAIQRLEEPPVIFLRTSDVREMTAPDLDDPATTDELAAFFNLSREDFSLVLAWICLAHDAEIDFPVLLVEGPSGAGKSFIQSQAAMLVDNDGSLGRADIIRGTVEDLYSVAVTRWVLSPDNLSRLDAARSDALCKVSTGVTASTRVLGATAGSATARLRLHRPVVISSVGLWGHGSDLENRILRVEAVRAHEMVADDELKRRFRAELPRLYARVLLTLQAALAQWDKAETAFSSLAPERLGGATKWLYAVGEVLDLDLVAAYRTHQIEGQLSALESEPFLDELLRTVREKHGGTYVGKATALLALVPTPARPSHDWPTDPRSVGKALKRNADVFRRLGWTVTFDKAGRVWHLKVMDKTHDEDGQGRESHALGPSTPDLPRPCRPLPGKEAA
jgi:hypothetical protein